MIVWIAARCELPYCKTDHVTRKEKAMNLGGIFSRTLSFLPLIGPIVNGIEALHKEAGTPGITKKQMAMDSLSLAVGVGDATLPEFQPEVDAAGELASGAIDLVVAGFNKLGWPKTAPVVVAPAIVPIKSGAPSLRVVG
jgi:hypothetical protein